MTRPRNNKSLPQQIIHHQPGGRNERVVAVGSITYHTRVHLLTNLAGLHIGSISPKWPWNRSSPTAVSTGSTNPNQGDTSPAWKYFRQHDDGQSGNSKSSTVFTPHSSTPLSPKPELAPSESVANPGTSSSIPKIDTAPISDISLTIAIDCSGSTSGGVLEQEKNIAQDITNVLSKDAQKRVAILPWNDEADSTLTLDEMDEMFSSGGTDPTALIRDRHYRQALLNSSLWVLVTDGLIDDSLVRDFAMQMGDVGLHGTPSIVVCIGYTYNPPAYCNISVGKSVFATVPHCMFLFHDVESENVYILQCKGRFKSLIPGSRDIVLDETTRWDDLPCIFYGDLQGFQVPNKRTLLPDTVLLTSGRSFSLQDIYNDTLDSQIASEILSNDDDLKTLLLTASTRGRKEDVKRWISKKRLSISDPMWTKREDIGHAAYTNLRKLVEALRNSTTMKVPYLTSSVLIAHQTNWADFTGIASAEEQQAIVRDILIADATARLQLDDSGPASPCLMSPVSTATRAKVTETMFEGSETSSIESDTQLNYRSSRRMVRSQISSKASNEPDVLFTQGYRYLRRRSAKSSRSFRIAVKEAMGATTVKDDTSADSFKGVCTLCTRNDEIMALVLKKPEDDEQTPNYPAPQQNAKHKYPFVLGNFPDVDIISYELYCETCSVYLQRLGQSPKADNVLGALPLVSTHGKDYSINLQSWSKALTKAFQWRFHESIVLSVFLSVLYNTLDDLTSVDSTENTNLVRAIRWACRNLLQSILVARETDLIPLGETILSLDAPNSPISSAPLGEVLPPFIKSALHGHGPLLNYPLDGFLVLLLAARDVENESCERESLRCVAWLRLAMHMATEHYALMNSSAGREKARDRLYQILHTPDKSAKFKQDSDERVTLRKVPVSLASLEGTHLISSDDLESFRRLGTLFSQVGSKCGSSIAVYLHYLLEYSQMCSDAEQCFEAMRKEKALRKVFVAPEEVTLEKAADLIARLQSGKTG